MLLKLPGVTDVVVSGDAVTVRTSDADATLPALYALGRPIHGLEVGGGGLEEALLGPHRRSGQEAGAEQAPAHAASHADTVLPEVRQARHDRVPAIRDHPRTLRNVAVPGDAHRVPGGRCT